MKAQSLILKEKRGGLQAEIDAVLDTAENEGRTISAGSEDFAKLKDLREKRDAVSIEIEAAMLVESEQLAKAQRAIAAERAITGPAQDNLAEKREQSRLRQEFSFRKVIEYRVKGKPITSGVEAELMQQGENEARAAGVAAETPLPGFLMGAPKGMQKRADDLTVADATFAGSLVQASIGEVVDYLYPRTVLRDLGATFITGLRDGFDLINQDGAVSGTWEGEVDANAESNPTIAKTQVRPKRLGAYTVFSKQLVNQAVIDIENWVRRELGIAVGQALEVAAINGSGSAPIPRGVLNVSGIGDVAGGTDGAVPAWADLVELETDINAANAPMGRRAYLTTPGINGVLKTVKKDAGSGIFINENGMVNGYPMFFTSNVPSTLTKGTSSGVCHAILFGNWEELYVLQWGGIDLVVNPFSLDTTSQVRVTINSWWDIAVRHKESFSAMKDALLS